MGNLYALSWRKSSSSITNGACVEVAYVTVNSMAGNLADLQVYPSL